MAGNNSALYAASVTALGFICFALSATAIGLPIWGYFDSPRGGWDSDRGYFGPWKVCKELNYNREKCGPSATSFKPIVAVFISGICAAVGCACFGIFCILSVIQIAQISSREKVVLKYKSLVIVKLALALLGGILAIVSAGLFAVQTDDDRTGYRVTRGISFYLQILLIALSIGLFVLALYDVFNARKTGGDPTEGIDHTQTTAATTYNNPGFREGRTNGVSMTDSSGKPYSGSVTTNGGSIMSMNTTLTSMSNGSTLDSVTRSPLRSSLKKPKPRGENTLGIQNPGYSGSGHSPTMQRNGSVKKVRIQTHSTEV